MKHSFLSFLAGTAALTFLLFLSHPSLADEGAIDGRAELNWRLGSERSILMTEFWVPLYQPGTDRVLFGDLRLMGDDADSREFNMAAGYRQMTDLWGLEGIAGGMLWFDRRTTEYDSNFNQITLGMEWLANDFDIRLNGYVPISSKKEHLLSSVAARNAFLANTGIYYQTAGSNILVEEPQPGFDLELGVNVPFTERFTDSVRLYGAFFHFEGDKSESVTGWRTRIAADITPDFQIGGRFQRDDERGSQGFLEATVRFPFGNKSSYRSNGLRARLDESPERDIDIVTNAKAQVTQGQLVAIQNANGDAQRVVYVDNAAAAGGDGSMERPYNALADAQADLRAYDVLYIARGDGTTGGLDTGLSLTNAHSNVMVIGGSTRFVYDSGRFLAGGAESSLNGTVLREEGLPTLMTQTAPNSDVISVGGSNVYITGLEIENTVRHGIAVNASGGDSVTGLQIVNVTVRGGGTAEDGIRIHADGAGSSADVVIRQSDINTNKNGVRYYATGDASVSGAVERTRISSNTQHGVILYDDSTAGAVNVDLGGGANSEGRNALAGNTLEDLAVEIDGAQVIAQNNWWGQAGGPHTSAPSGGLRPQIYYGAPVADGLIGHWTLDSEWMSGTTAYDRSGNNRNGTMTNGLSDANVIAGQFREGLTFNGSTNIDLVASSQLIPGPNSPVTVIASFNPTTISGGNLEDRIFNIKRGVSSTNIALYVGNTNEAIFLTPETWIVPIDDTPISTGTFAQSAVTYDGTTYRPYLNGVADSAVVANNLSAGSGHLASIGAFTLGDTHFTGTIDDVRIYNRPLTAGEIAELNRMNTSSSVDSGSALNGAP